MEPKDAFFADANQSITMSIGRGMNSLVLEQIENALGVVEDKDWNTIQGAGTAYLIQHLELVQLMISQAVAEEWVYIHEERRAIINTDADYAVFLMAAEERALEACWYLFGTRMTMAALEAYAPKLK